jgi:hypothetical protein
MEEDLGENLKEKERNDEGHSTHTTNEPRHSMHTTYSTLLGS